MSAVAKMNVEAERQGAEAFLRGILQNPILLDAQKTAEKDRTAREMRLRRLLFIALKNVAESTVQRYLVIGAYSESNHR